MPSIHRVIDYSGLSYYDALDLPCDVFALMLKHSIIDDYNKTEAGREYLEKCKRLQQSDIDISAFRKMKAGNRKGGIKHGNS